MEPRIEPDSNKFAALADAETVPAGTQELEEVRDIRERSSHVSDPDRVPETIVDVLEEDLGWREQLSVRRRTFSPCIVLEGDWFSCRSRQAHHVPCRTVQISLQQLLMSRTCR